MIYGIKSMRRRLYINESASVEIFRILVRNFGVLVRILCLTTVSIEILTFSSEIQNSYQKSRIFILGLSDLLPFFISIFNGETFNFCKPKWSVNYFQGYAAGILLVISQQISSGILPTILRFAQIFMKRFF